MTSPADISSETLKALEDTFKVSKETSKYYSDFYNGRILPRIQNKYLAHLIIAVEEMIDEKLRESSKEKSQENIAEESIPGENMGRKFTIALLSVNKLPMGLELPPGNSKASAFCYRKCAVIYYEPIEDTKKLRIFIAHEVGHVLRHYKIIQGTEEIENHVNTFAYFAIGGKNKFYKAKVQRFLYETEEEIISCIQEACPISHF
jgi:uncharacterized protein YjaZ